MKNKDDKPSYEQGQKLVLSDDETRKLLRNLLVRFTYMSICLSPYFEEDLAEYCRLVTKDPTTLCISSFYTENT